jgi:transcription elongation GreA/GreB family factor
VEQALDAARRGAQVLPDSDVLREVLAELYAETRSDREDIESLVRLTLRSSGMPADEALAALEKALALHPGSYVLDPRDGTVGRVEQFDLEKGGLVVNIGGSEKPYSVGFVGRLELVDEDDFRALMIFERERVAKLAVEDPEELVQLVLTTLDRRMELRRLKLYLGPLVGSWNKWWGRAREVLSRSAVIGMTEGSSPSIFLRRKPLTHGERLLKKLDGLHEPLEKLAMALHVMQEARDHGSPEPAELRPVADQVAALGRQLAAAGSAGLALCAAAVVDGMCRAFPELPRPQGPPPESFAETLNDLQGLPAAVPDLELLGAVLDYMHHAEPQRWAQLHASLMPALPRQVCAKAAHQLAAAGETAALERACSDILNLPDRSPGALAWLWRDATGQSPIVPASIDKIELVVRILVEMADIVRASGLSEDQRKEDLAELRAALFVRDARPLRDALQGATREQTGILKGLAEYHPGLTDNMRTIATDILRELQPSLFIKKVDPWEESVVYSTEAGLAKRRGELEYLVHERLPEVMREIGQAAQFGDISENAEYSAAVEERGRLAARAGRMQEEIAEARPITREMATSDRVSVGSRVRVRNLITGEEQTFTFLGPWDADPDRGIMAYNAPLGEAFMGKKVGDEVAYLAGTEERRWAVLGTEPGV